MCRLGTTPKVGSSVGASAWAGLYGQLATPLTYTFAGASRRMPQSRPGDTTIEALAKQGQTPAAHREPALSRPLV